MNGKKKHGDLKMEKWLTLEQIAEYLQMSTSSIYKMAQKGKIPAYKVGRQWRFKKEEIDRWIERGKLGIEVSKLQRNRNK